MALFMRAKRVRDPLDEKVRTRLISYDTDGLKSYTSSGSEHEAAGADPLIDHSFLETDEAFVSSNDANSSAHEGSDGDGARAVETLRKLMDLSRVSDPIRSYLQSDVMQAAKSLSDLKCSGSAYRRAVMTRLRERGFNAGICKARWESCGGLKAGSYEYIDILWNGQKRFIVDLDFAAEFEIARATIEYKKLVTTLPRVMVGRTEEVRQVVRIMAEAPRSSLKKRELHVPPWRKSRFMVAKWLGPYRRTVNPLPSSARPAVIGRGEVKCRAVGFAVPTSRAASIGGSDRVERR